jgi:bifunctional DNA-binding transcriptional regulator/antitoxin component of YhaV-PrlF toxin-antitoxin module
MSPRVIVLTLDPKGRTTLPSEVREELGGGAGDFILLERTDRGTFGTPEEAQAFLDSLKRPAAGPALASRPPSP